jgi:hypothetical protein
MRPFLILAVGAAILSTMLGHAFAQAASCGSPPVVDDGSIKGTLDSKASFLKTFVGEVGLTGQVEIAKNDVLSRYPNADQLRLKQYFLYVICMQIMTDTKLGTLEKIKAFHDASDVVFPPKSGSTEPTNVFSMQATFTVCKVDNIKRCPKGAIWYNCSQFSIFQAIKETCTKFRANVISNEAGGYCGLEVATITCTVSSLT